MRHSFSVSDRGRQSFAARSTSVMRSLFSEPLADSRLLADGSPGRLASTSTSCIRARRHRRPAPARTIGAADMLGVGHVADLVKEAQLVTVICAFTIVRKEAAIIQIVGRAGLWFSVPLRQGSWGSFGRYLFSIGDHRLNQNMSARYLRACKASLRTIEKIQFIAANSATRANAQGGRREMQVERALSNVPWKFGPSPHSHY